MRERIMEVEETCIVAQSYKKERELDCAYIRIIIYYYNRVDRNSERAISRGIIIIASGIANEKRQRC